MAIGIATAEKDLQGILALQQLNLKRNVPLNLLKEQGFVTVEHRPNILTAMNNVLPSIVARDDCDNIVGYALSMPREFVRDVPELHTHFERFNSVEYDGRPMNQYHYYMMGQSCVASEYRGQKVLARMLQYHRALHGDLYQLLVTTISQENPRSLRAHMAAADFVIVASFHDRNTDSGWHVLVWDWRRVSRQ
jgi:hypothetical protein